MSNRARRLGVDCVDMSTPLLFIYLFDSDIREKFTSKTLQRAVQQGSAEKH